MAESKHAGPEPDPNPDPLQPIGGVDGLLEILRAFYQRVAQDVWIGFFFQGRDLDGIIRGQHAFLLGALGGRPGPSGRQARDAHDVLVPIREGHLARRLKLLKETLTARGVPTELSERWLAVERGVGAAILRRAASERPG